MKERLNKGLFRKKYESFLDTIILFLMFLSSIDKIDIGNLIYRIYFGLELFILTLAVIVYVVRILLKKEFPFNIRVQQKKGFRRNPNSFYARGISLILSLFIIYNKQDESYLLLMIFGINILFVVVYRTYCYFLGYTSEYFYIMMLSDEKSNNPDIRKEYLAMIDMVSMETNRKEGRKYFTELDKYYYNLLY